MSKLWKATYSQTVWQASEYHPGVEESGMMCKVYLATREALVPLRVSIADNAANERSQKGTRESDAVIVPVISSNSEIGKDGTQVSPVQGTHSLYTG